MSKHHKNPYKWASKERKVFPPRVCSFRMGTGVFCLTFIWPRSHDHTTDQSNNLQNVILLFFSFLQLSVTFDS